MTDDQILKLKAMALIITRGALALDEGEISQAQGAFMLLATATDNLLGGLSELDTSLEVKLMVITIARHRGMSMEDTK